MAEKLKGECASQNLELSFPPLPPKTWTTVLHDKEFLEHRKRQFETFLDNVLAEMTRKNLMLPFALSGFLQINPFVP